MLTRRFGPKDFSGGIPRRLAVFVALLIAVAVVPVAAQVADATIAVVTTDEQGQILPGVTVTVRKPDTGFERVVVTNNVGEARIPALEPGTYQVRFDLQGFAQVVQESLTLRVGQTARLDVRMKVAGVQETITVEAAVAPLVDVYKTDSSTNIIPEQIQDLPIQDRDFQHLAFITPGVQRERGGYRFVAGGPVLGASGNASQATILVDGVDFTDPTLGLARARFSQDAIGEFRVITNRFDTEVGNSAGGAISIVTKSGTNELSGSAFGFFRDKSLRAKGELEQSKVDYSRQQFGATLGGPITKDKTHFFLSFEQINEDSFALFRPGGAYASLADDVKVPLTQSLVFAGLDHQISDRQSLKVKFVYERYRLENFRVGGVADVSNGQQLNRDNWNVTAGHTWNLASNQVNSLNFQWGQRKYDEPTNSDTLNELFSSGNTLSTGGNLVGNLLGESHQWELRDTFFWTMGRHAVKLGFAWEHVKDRFDFPVYEFGQLQYLSDTRAIPFLYVYGDGSGDATIKTDLLAGFVQDDFKPISNLTLSLGVRYDLDTNGNNPDFTNPLLPGPRGKDTNNFQPRFGFSWDVKSDGRHVVRGGVGLFTGRFLLVPSFAELQQNGVTGRKILIRVSVPPYFPLNPSNPTQTGYPLPVSPTLLDDSFVNPEATQTTLGYTMKLGETGLFLDFEGVYVKGRKEIILRDKNFAGNAAIAAGAPARPNPQYTQINVYTNEGKSQYKAFVTSLNGTIAGKHVIASSFTIASKKNTEDDFSPALTDYPSDPFDIAAEYGRSRADERYHFVASVVFKLPWLLTVSPIYEYGSGQPWNRRYGYDYNGDLRASDRPAGVPRFSMDGPRFSQLSVRLSKRFPFGKRGGVDLIAEAFNLLNTVNYDVNSIQTGEFLSGPTLTNPALPAVPNPAYGQPTATLPPFEAQLGVRVQF
jgi:Carboxypeptidase regulatory-like domain/TonB dependent receptor-like, beta-barrel